MDVYCKAMYAGIFGGHFGDAEADGLGIFHHPRPKTSLMYNGSTRQYLNMGWVLNFAGKETMAKQMEFIDPYLTSIIASEDFDPRKYRTSFWVPEGLSFKKMWRMIQFGRKVSGGESYLEDPEGSMESYFALKESNEREFDRIAPTGAPLLDGGVGGLKDFATLLHESIRPTLVEEMILINNHVLAVFQEVDEQRRNGKTEEIQKDFEALCGGYEGDVLMELNITLHRLGRSLPKDAWKDGSSAALADRIAEERDLPAEFLTEWRSFLDRYGFDGQDQLFVASPRYRDSPSRLLEMMRMNASDSAKDPSAVAEDLLSKRRAVMAKQEATAARELDGCSHLRAWTRWKLRRKLDAVRRRNTVLDRFMRVRNSPKMYLTKLVGTLRSAVLRIEEKLIAEGRLREKGDVFHLTIDEIDEALSEGRRRRTGGAAVGTGTTTTTDLTELVRFRKPGYDAAVAAKTCPLLVDSRCRILKPDPPPAFRGGDDGSEEGAVLVGSAISPGIATGTVRIVPDLSPERILLLRDRTGGPANNHVLCAVVTGPAWTPLFASASAVVLQVGGVVRMKDPNQNPRMRIRKKSLHVKEGNRSCRRGELQLCQLVS